MNRIKKLFTLIHILTWILFTLLICWLYRIFGTSYWPASSAGLLLTGLYVFYGHFFLLTFQLSQRKYIAYLQGLTGLLLTGTFPFLIFQLFRQEELHATTIFTVYTESPILIFVLVLVVLSWLARVIEDWFIIPLKQEQLEKEAVHAELYHLKSQINPHFLFNTLNNIHWLVHKQSASAPEAVLHLSSLMRYMIYESNAPTVVLSKEMQYLLDYVSLQQLRFKNGPVVDLKIEGDTSSCSIAPLLFIHLLENAFKHSPARLKPGDVKVNVEIKENTLTFAIQNPVGNISGNTLEVPGGIGLPNVQKRLQLLYPGRHTLEINSQDEKFMVNLQIHGLTLQDYERKTHLLYHR